MALPKLNVPQYKVTLPSTSEQLNMRPYLVKEEKVLLMALESKDPEQITEAIRNIITGCYNIKDVNKLTSFDLEYLFLQLRAKSVGEKLKLRYTCQADDCKFETPAELDIEKLEVSGLDQQTTYMLNEEMGVGISMRYPTLSALEDMKHTNLDTAEGLLELVRVCIETIFDKDSVYNVEDHTPEELSDFVGSFTAEQFKYVQEFFLNVPAIVYKTKYDCRECGHTNEIEIKGLQSFFT